MERIFVISRIDRHHRLVAFRRRWARTLLASRVVEEYLAPIAEDPVAGCLASHLAVLHQCHQPTLILEDDACFAPAFPYHAIPPTNWDVLWLGGKHLSPPRPVVTGYGEVSVAWVRPVELLRTHAYVARDPAALAATFVATNPPRMDPYLARLPLNQYCAEPQTVGQVAGDSDTSDEHLAKDSWWHLFGAMRSGAMTRRNPWRSRRITG
jgi:hypothetical protein